jgi:hypothetical protein
MSINAPLYSLHLKVPSQTFQYLYIAMPLNRPSSFVVPLHPLRDLLAPQLIRHPFVLTKPSSFLDFVHHTPVLSGEDAKTTSVFLAMTFDVEFGTSTHGS